MSPRLVAIGKIRNDVTDRGELGEEPADDRGELLRSRAGLPPGPARGGVTASCTEPATLALALAEVVVGLAIAVFAIRRGSVRLIAPLRRIHTGVVNDYALLQAGGVVIAAVALLG